MASRTPSKMGILRDGASEMGILRDGAPMRRRWAWVGVGMAGLVLAATWWMMLSFVHAAPPRLECSPDEARIESPSPGTTVRGTIQIRGNAALRANMDYYQLAISPMNAETWWTFVELERGERHAAILGELDTRQLADGAYQIRLRVVDRTGNYCESIIPNILIQNAAPPSQPTATPTGTLELRPTAPPLTLTPPVPTALPTIELPPETSTPPSTGGPQTRPTTIVISGPARSPTPAAGLPDLLNPAALASGATTFAQDAAASFVWGVKLMAGLVLLVGIVIVLRHWL